MCAAETLFLNQEGKHESDGLEKMVCHAVGR
jgi:hypothetical protein